MRFPYLILLANSELSVGPKINFFFLVWNFLVLDSSNIMSLVSQIPDPTLWYCYYIQYLFPSDMIFIMLHCTHFLYKIWKKSLSSVHGFSSTTSNALCKCLFHQESIFPVIALFAFNILTWYTILRLQLKPIVSSPHFKYKMPVTVISISSQGNLMKNKSQGIWTYWAW